MATPMDIDSLCPSPPRSEPNEVDIPHEQIRRTMTIMLNVFAVCPLDAYHPGRHIALRDAVPVLSSLDRSHGLTDDQVEGLGRLLSNWNRIINNAVEANEAKKKATQQLSTGNEYALNLQMAKSKEQVLQDKRWKIEDGWCKPPRVAAKLRRDYLRPIAEELTKNHMVMETLEERSRYTDLMAPTLKQQIENAEESMEKANQEWKALEMLLLEINSSLVLK